MCELYSELLLLERADTLHAPLNWQAVFQYEKIKENGERKETDSVADDFRELRFANSLNLRLVY